MRAISLLVCLLLVSFSQGVRAAETNCREGVAYLPMAIKGQGMTPGELANQVQKFLDEGDVHGKKLIPRTNATSSDFLRAVNQAGGKVTTLSLLPEYLRSLHKSDMPDGLLTLSRIKRTVGKNCRKERILDVSTGYSRSAGKGEVAWCDPNTNLMMFADNCSNSPIIPTLCPGKPQRTVARSADRPYLGQCTAPPYARLLVWDDMVYGQVPGLSSVVASTTTELYSPINRLSRQKGLELWQCYDNGKGRCILSTATNRATLSYINMDVNERITKSRYIGTVAVVGDQKVSLPELEKWDAVRIEYPCSGISSPKLGTAGTCDIRVFTYEWFELGRCQRGQRIHAIKKEMTTS